MICQMLFTYIANNNNFSNFDFKRKLMRSNSFIYAIHMAYFVNLRNLIVSIMDFWELYQVTEVVHPSEVVGFGYNFPKNT